MFDNALVLGLERIFTEMLVPVAMKLHMAFSADIPLAELLKNPYLLRAFLLYQHTEKT